MGVVFIEDRVAEEDHNIAQMRLKIIRLHVFATDADEEDGSTAQITLFFKLYVIFGIFCLIFRLHKNPLTFLHFLKNGLLFL